MTEYEKAGKLFYFPIVQAPDEQWALGSGKITPHMIENFMPPKSKIENVKVLIDCPDSITLVCGN